MNSTNTNILARAIACRAKSKTSIQEVLQIIKTDERLIRISDKGIYITVLSQLLLKAFIAYQLKIKSMFTDFANKDIKKRKRRSDNHQGRTNRKTKKRKDKPRGRALQNLANIQDLSNESISNPSNIQRPRINVQSHMKTEQNSNPAQSSKEDSKGSKESGEEKLRLQLNKITQQIRGHQETFVPEMDDFPGITIEDNSQSTSNSNPSQISNLNEKLKIFTNIKGSEVQKTRKKTAARNRSTSRGITTKKKPNIIDQTTFIEETGQDLTQITLNQSKIEPFQHIQALDYHEEFIDGLKGPKIIQLSDFMTFEKMVNMRQFVQHENIVNPIENYDRVQYVDPMMKLENDNDYADIAFPDYTMSQPATFPVYAQDYVKDSIQVGSAEITLNVLAKKTKKQQPILFYQLLWKLQNNEIDMTQNSPQSFSDILVRDY